MVKIRNDSESGGRKYQEVSGEKRHYFQVINTIGVMEIYGKSDIEP